MHLTCRLGSSLHTPASPIHRHSSRPYEVRIAGQDTGPWPIWRIHSDRDLRQEDPNFQTPSSDWALPFLKIRSFIMTVDGDGLYHTSTPTSSSPNAPEFDALCEAAIQTFGPCSLTVLAWLPDRGVLKRIWTANKVRGTRGNVVS